MEKTDGKDNMDSYSLEFDALKNYLAERDLGRVEGKFKKRELRWGLPSV